MQTLIAIYSIVGAACFLFTTIHINGYTKRDIRILPYCTFGIICGPIACVLMAVVAVGIGMNWVFNQLASRKFIDLISKDSSK